jgi:hypothetical protein
VPAKRPYTLISQIYRINTANKNFIPQDHAATRTNTRQDAKDFFQKVLTRFILKWILTYINMNANLPMPILKVIQAILESAYESANIIKPNIGFLTDQENKTRWTLVYNEFLFFYLHFFNRTALSEIGEAKTVELQNLIGPVVVDAVVETFYREWSHDLICGLKSEYYNNINNAEMEYSQCNCIIDENNPFSHKSLLIQLSRRVTHLCSTPTDKKLIWLVIETSFNAIKTMQLHKLTAETKVYLNGPDDN